MFILSICILSIDIHRFPPLRFPPLMGGDFPLRGGGNHDPAEGRKFFGDFVSKSFGQRCENALKTCFLQEKIIFSKHTISKFSRLRRGYYPSNYSNHNYPDDVLRKVIIRKTIIQLTLFKYNYSNAII